MKGSNSKLAEAARPGTVGPEPAKPQTASQDRYSALKELDELFKSTTINSKQAFQEHLPNQKIVRKLQ